MTIRWLLKSAISVSLLIPAFITPSQVRAASVSIQSAPNTIKIQETATVVFSASLSPNTQYFVKIRGGQETNKMTYVETKHPETDQWFGDTDSWTGMPKITTIDDGTANTQLQFRYKTSATVGVNKLVVRFAKADSTSNTVDSDTVEVTVSAADTVPSPSPTAAPTATAAPTNTPAPTATPKPSTDYNNVHLTEVYPSPDSGSNEWVEIYNGNDGEVNLNGWYIQDNAGTYKEIREFKIAGKSFAYFAFGSGYLNNVGDTVTLLNAEKQAKSSLPTAYPNLNSSQSWAKVGDDWCVASPNKGEENKECLSEKALTTGTPKPSASARASSTPSSKPKPSHEASGSAEDRYKLPVLGSFTEHPDASAGQKVKQKRSLPKLLIPFTIAGSGLLLLGGSLTALNKPELITSIIRTIIHR